MGPNNYSKYREKKWNQTITVNIEKKWDQTITVKCARIERDRKNFKKNLNRTSC